MLGAVVIAQRLIEDVQQFKTNMWVVELLTIEVMVKKPHQWKDFFAKIEKPGVEPNDDMTLRTLLEMDIFAKREQVEEFSRRVDKIYSLEKKINEMVEALRAIKVGIVAYKSTHVLASLEEITQQLDDQFNVLNFMKVSPFIKPILKRVDDLEKRLLVIQDTLEGWIKCQRSWMYLEPIFASDDIKKKMALEHQKFVAIDRNFRQTMEHFNKDPHLWDNIDSDKMKNDFDQNNKYILYLRFPIFICSSLNNSISFLASEFLL
jgi:dynein heavy chain